jgi:predicted RNA-binding protein YlxR (DUF448 family)
MKKLQPIRMCILCRKRLCQKSLIRFKYQDDLVVGYDGKGRSFYLCMECSQDHKKLLALSKRFGQDKEYIVSIVEEMQKRYFEVVIK